MQLFAKFKKILRRGFRATLNSQYLAAPASRDQCDAYVGSMTIRVKHLAVYIEVAGDLHLNSSLRQIKGDIASFFVQSPLSNCVVITRWFCEVYSANKMDAFKCLEKNKN